MSTNNYTRNEDVVTLTAVVDGDDWKAAKKKATAKAAAKMNIKGFRKGKVPADMVKKFLGNDYLLELAAEEVAQPKLSEMVDEYKIRLVDRPTLDIPSIDKDSVTLVFTCPVVPELKLGQWKDLGIEKETAEVTDEEVENAIEQLRAQKANKELVEEGEAENGDTVEIDFEGFIDGKPFEGGKAENVSLELGSGRMIPGFEEQLVGIKPNEEKEITVTFPEDYQVEDLAGKEATFKIKAHDVYRTVKPELTDEFVEKELDRFEAKTIDELKAEIKKNILANKQDELDEKRVNALLTAIRGNTEADIPESMVEEEIDSRVRNTDMQLRQNGLTLDQFLSITGQSKDEYRDSLRDQAATNVFNTLILEAIAKEEKLEVTDEEADKALEDYAKEMNADLEQVKKLINKEQFKESLIYDKATDALLNAQ